MDISKKTKDELKAICKEKGIAGFSKLNLTELRALVQPHVNEIVTVVDYTKKTRDELIAICKEKGLKGYSTKKKDDIVKLLSEKPVEASLVNEIVATQHDTTGSDKLRMIDLFAGTGAFSFAFQGTNAVNVVFANDMVAHSKTIYDQNFNHTLTLKNLHEVKNEDIPAHDLLTGGFPCQPFSIAGQREGFKDERSNVFWKILSIIDHHQPQCVILENVKNLTTHDNTKTFTTIKSNLETRGYHICHKVLDTAKITGIPQHRERIYIVCLKSKAVFDKFNLDFSLIEKKPIVNFLETGDIPSKYYYTEEKNSNRPWVTAENTIEGEIVGSAEPAVNTITDEEDGDSDGTDDNTKPTGPRKSIWQMVKENVTKKNTFYQYRRTIVRENMSNECPTLTANMGGGGHNVPIVLDAKGIRKLTPRECFNFQGFPASYKLPQLSDGHLYKLAGNAVSVPVVKLIADRIMGLLI